MQTTPSNSASLWQPWRLPAAVACNLGALYTMQGLLRPLFLRALTALGVHAGGMEIAQQAWISVVYFVCYALVYRLLLPDAPQYTSAPIQRRFLLPFAGILLGLAVCGQLVSSILVVLCGQWGLMLQGVSMAVPSHPVAFVWSWLNLTIWPAWIEEKVFRVRVLGFLSPCGARFCAVYTAALFALLHGNLLQMPSAFLIGCLFATAVFETGSVRTTMLLHAFHNAWVYGFSLCLMHLPDRTGTLCTLLLYGIWLILGWMGWRALNGQSDWKAAHKAPCAPLRHIPTAQQMRWPCAIALVIVLLFHCLQFVA